MVRAMKKNHYKNWKKEQLKELENFVEKPVVALADISNLPAGAMQHFRKVLKDNGFSVKVSKLRLIKKVLEKKGFKDLSEKYANGSIAVIVGDANPFKLYGLIKRNASTTGAKTGMIAPEDIVIPAGDTNIPPGPALSDFKAVRINTQIRNGHIFVAEDTKIANKGDVIDAKVATILTKLNIKPIKVLLKVKGAYEKSDNILYDASVLDINIEDVRNNFINAYQNAYYLALGKAIITKDTIKPLIAKAYRESKGLATETGIINKDTIKDIIVKANNVISHLNKKING